MGTGCTQKSAADEREARIWGLVKPRLDNQVGKSESGQEGLKSQIKLEWLPALPFGQITSDQSLNSQSINFLICQMVQTNSGSQDSVMKMKSDDVCNVPGNPKWCSHYHHHYDYSYLHTSKAGDEEANESPRQEGPRGLACCTQSKRQVQGLALLTRNQVIQEIRGRGTWPMHRCQIMVTPWLRHRAFKWFQQKEDHPTESTWYRSARRQKQDTGILPDWRETRGLRREPQAGKFSPHIYNSDNDEVSTQRSVLQMVQGYPQRRKSPLVRDRPPTMSPHPSLLRVAKCQ